MSKRMLAIAVAGGFALVAAVPVAWKLADAHGGRAEAGELLAHQLWPQARQRLNDYLWLYPGDGEARLLLAEAFAKDNALPPNQAAELAVACLKSVPDESPHAAEARLQQGRLTFLILQRPVEAEGYLRQAIDLDAGLNAYQLLWTLLCFTGRSDESADVFWKVYELSPEDQQPLRLREWYLKQFFPLTADEGLDQAMGILKPGETPSRITESRRYLRFRDREPGAPQNHAAVANWCQQEGDPEFAVRVLEAAAKTNPAAQSERSFLSATIAAELDLGRFEKAEEAFRHWPAEDRSQAYWRWHAVVHDEALGEPEKALPAYDRALAAWPGPPDWRLHHRRVGCLLRLKKTAEAAVAKERAEAIQSLMDSNSHERMRANLAALDDPQKLAEVIEFYRRVGLPREADAWQRHVTRLTAQAAKRE
jgi:tetratricopeptide (TPR) repeat protein